MGKMPVDQLLEEVKAFSRDEQQHIRETLDAWLRQERLEDQLEHMLYDADLLSVGRWLPCPRSVVSITIMSDGRHEIRSARLLVPGAPGTLGTPEAGAAPRGAQPRGVWSMSLTIILDDTLVAQLQVQAAARSLSVEALALQILNHAVVHEDDTTWRTANQRRIALIRKQFAEGLRADEADELHQLQDMADQQVERFDAQRLDDVQQLYRQAKRLVDGASE